MLKVWCELRSAGLPTVQFAVNCLVSPLPAGTEILLSWGTICTHGLQTFMSPVASALAHIIQGIKPCCYSLVYSRPRGFRNLFCYYSLVLLSALAPIVAPVSDHTWQIEPAADEELLEHFNDVSYPLPQVELPFTVDGDCEDDDGPPPLNDDNSSDEEDDYSPRRRRTTTSSISSNSTLSANKGIMV